MDRCPIVGNCPWRAFAAACVSLALMRATASAQNLTPGDNVGSDHAAYAFAPYVWIAPIYSPTYIYRDHVCSGPNSGQQYFWVSSEEDVAPNPRPTVCTVSNFAHQIHDSENVLGTLFIFTHGDSNELAIEPYALTPAGLAARDSAFDAYVSQGIYVPGVEITKFLTAESYAIGVTAQFIRNYGRLTQALVYIEACLGGTLTDDFVAAGARVAVGPPECIPLIDAHVDVDIFFSRMDGKQGQAKRPVAAAMAGLNLVSSGATNTTLAPSVLSVSAPCPIKVGDNVVYTLDTACDPATIPDIEGTNATIQNETWLDRFTLRGTCTAPPPPGSYNYYLTLKWGTLRSAQNIARLDGNTIPSGSNAEGPAHDDHSTHYVCSSVPIASPSGTTLILVLLLAIGLWALPRRGADGIRG